MAIKSGGRKGCRFFHIFACMGVKSAFYRILNISGGFHQGGPESEETKMLYSDLTPTTACDDKEVYCRALEWALRNPQIRNLALSGPYGSGKSSVLKKFREKSGVGDRCIDISLASLSKTAEDLSGKDLMQQKERIEMSILQQIFYCERARRIPDSRFKRIRRLTSRSLLMQSLGVVGLVLVGLFPLYFSEIMPDIGSVCRANIMRGWLVALFLGLAHFTVKLLRVINGSKLNKLNLKNAEIELSKETDPSILNKYLDEILYFFEVTKYDVVILEDLDRFDDPEIFTKLREINLLLNNSKQVGRRIVFIYAVRDDLFLDKNRTKFFDFIVPVIPVINPTNASEVFTRILGEEVSPQLLDDISLYVDDMRLLKNICNEYFIYKENLSKGLNQDKIFALIVYKNLFPEDFVDLHVSRGMVARAFERKQELAQSLVERIEKRQVELDRELKELENLRITDLQELRAVYLEEIREQLPSNAEALEVDGERVTYKTLREEGFPDTFIQATPIRFYYDRYYHRDSSIHFQNIERKINPNLSYREREKLILNKNSRGIEGVKRELEHLKIERVEVASRSLQQLLEENEGVRVFEKETSNADLIVYLLRYGYIAEDYQYYISLFHEGSRTQADQDYLLSVKNRKALPFTYQLNKIENLLKHIRATEFGYKEILNDSLTDFLLTECSSGDERVGLYFKQLSNESDTSLRYIDHYLMRGSHKPEFVARLAKDWPQWWDWVGDHDERYSERMLESWFRLLLQHAEMKDIIIQDTNRSISQYILERRDFLTWAEWEHTDDGHQRLSQPIDINAILQRSSYYEKIRKVIDRLKIRFTALDVPQGASPILDHIYENGRYELTPEMIALFVQTKGKDVRVEDLQTANYSTILASGCEPLIDRVEEDIKTYTDRVFLPLEMNTQETEEAVVRLLNNSALTEEQKTAIIRKEVVRLEDITDVSDQTLWVELLREDRMRSTWGNVVIYYEYAGKVFDDDLIEFLNRSENYTKLSKAKFDAGEEMAEEDKESLSVALIECEGLSIGSYTALLQGIPQAYSRWKNINLADFSKEKVGVLIEQGFLALTPENYDFLKAHFKPKHITFLEYHATQCDSFADLFEFDNEDVHALLESAIFSLTQKVRLIHTVDENLIIEREATCALVGRLLHKAQDQSVLSFTLLEHLVRHASEPEQKVRLMLWHWDVVQDEDRITALLQACGEPYSQLTQKGPRPTLQPTEYNYSLAEKLEEFGYISSISKEKNAIRINTKQK